MNPKFNQRLRRSGCILRYPIALADSTDGEAQVKERIETTITPESDAEVASPTGSESPAVSSMTTSPLESIETTEIPSSDAEAIFVGLPVRALTRSPVVADPSALTAPPSACLVLLEDVVGATAAYPLYSAGRFHADGSQLDTIPIGGAGEEPMELDFEEWEIVDPELQPRAASGSPTDDFDHVDPSQIDSAEYLAQLKADRKARSILPPLRSALDTSVAAALDINEQTKPYQEAVGQFALTGALAVGSTLHDTAVDFVDTVQSIPWCDAAYATASALGTSVMTVGRTGRTIAVTLGNTPLGQRVIGGLDGGLTHLRLGVVSQTSSVLRSLRGTIQSAVDALDQQQDELTKKLNPNGLPLGEVVTFDDDPEVPSGHTSEEDD